uniref:Uncharacterized protein n=1 Tax=Glossina pallidipes TaxID=7398 RepID=A0A1A9ZN90_GLOPL
QSGPGQSPGQSGPGQSPGQSGPGQSPGQSGPGQSPGQSGPGQSPGQSGPGQSPGQSGPGQSPGQSGPGQSPGQSGPGKSPGQSGPGQSPGQSGPGQSPGQSGPGSYLKKTKKKKETVKEEKSDQNNIPREAKVELLVLDNPPMISTHLNYNCRSNNKCCDNFVATILTADSSSVSVLLVCLIVRFGKLMFQAPHLLIIRIHFISTVFGPELWLTKLRYFECEVRTMPLYFLFGVDLLFGVRYTKVVNNEGGGKNESAVVGTSSIALAPVILPAFIIAQKPTQNIFVEHVSLYFTTFGLVAAKGTNKWMIAHMTKVQMKYLD